MCTLLKAIKASNVDLVKEHLLTTDPSVNNNRAIRWASYYGNIEIIKLLLSDKRVQFYK